MYTGQNDKKTPGGPFHHGLPGVSIVFRGADNRFAVLITLGRVFLLGGKLQGLPFPRHALGASLEDIAL